MRIHIHIPDWLKEKGHILILVIFGLLYLVLACANHYFFRSFAQDYGTYNHQLWDNAHFIHNPNFIARWDKGVFFLQLHLYILFYALTPVYWLLSWLSGTYTLLIVQSLFVVFGAYGVYLFIKEYTDKPWLALSSLLLYFLFLGRWTALTSDFNDYTYGTTLIPWFFLLNYRRQWAGAFVLMFLLWLNKENMAILTFFFSLFFMIKYWRNPPVRWANLSFMGLSAGWFVFTFTVLVPWVKESAGANQYAIFQYKALGETPLEALKTIIAQPLETLSLLFVNHSPGVAPEGVKLETYLVFLLSGGFLLFLRPLYLLLFLPVFAQKMLNPAFYVWSIYGFYITDLAVLLPLSSGMVIKDICKNNTIQKMLDIPLLLLTLGVSIWKMDAERAIPWYSPAKECPYCPDSYSAPFDAAAVHGHIEKLPGEARVSASSAILPHLAFREHIYMFPATFDAEYIVILQTDAYPLTPEQMAAEIEKYSQNPDWELIVNEKPLFIFKRIGRKTKICLSGNLAPKSL